MPPFVGERDQDKEDIADLESEILLGFVGSLGFRAEPVIQLARELPDLLDESREVDEGRPVAFLEPRDPRVDAGLGFLEVHGSKTDSALQLFP